jgi:Rhodopirellula transposase DDE domain
VVVITEDEIRRKYEALSPLMDERMRRCWAGVEADAIGEGGIAIVERATGMSRTTIRAGRDEARGGLRDVDAEQVRRAGGGRPRLEEQDPGLMTELESLVDPVTRGDPESPLRWTSKSTRKLATELTERGKPISPQKVGQLLFALGYRLNAAQKTLEGTDHPDRNEQFEFINERVESCQARSAPVISVDTKKKELVGDFKNAGREWQPMGEPVAVRVHDFIDPDLGKVIPYGVYDLGRNEGWVNVGIDHDTPEFAVASISRWWAQMGRKVYPNASELLITADAGGSNGYRSRLFKIELQKFADRTGLTIGVSHFPPGTSKWNKIEHRMFCHITENWRGRPLLDHETVVQLIGATRTTAGLRVKAKLDRRSYPVGLKATDAQMREINLIEEDFHGDWNYTIVPRTMES